MEPTDMLEALAMRASRVERLADNWHGDLHLRVWDETGTSWSVRAVRLGNPYRWEDTRPKTANVVLRQIEIGRRLRDAGLPFMEVAREPLETLDHVLVVFRWVPASPPANPTVEMASQVGQLLRRFHTVGARLDPTGLPRHDTAIMARRSIAKLDDVVAADLLTVARDVATRLERRSVRIATHGDLNLPNVLFDDRRLCAVVDFDQIGEQDPLEELAWTVKWWSREGKVHDRALAQAVLDGYGGAIDREALTPILWVSACLNSNGVRKILGARERRSEVTKMAASLWARADALANLVR